MKARAKKFNDNKLRFSLLQIKALQEVIKVAEMGAKKYGDFNYKKGRPVRDWIDAEFRHVHLGFMQGEDNDRESKISHLAHGAWNLLTALEQMLEQPELDDRYKNDNDK